ncbi:hypothetical protein CAPTEDRAFT_221467 [Capitella teleta]|uniref:PR domain zinc finger protein 8 n=1 Tax=Capitella teleta TaxID=283909 RepID=R7TU63_CAPTE|nr:hypothetical protein CAPTEDRAFT_221467 [Capitella teleta]|eukprot:ELT97137.1 hypothetical protein CAPTEDRAFT_221467 [Capitella teleta]
MGVVTTEEVSEGQTFGPIPMTLTLAEPAVLIGHRTCDTPPDIHAVKLDITAYREGIGLAEWVPYVQAAREASEQNMEAFLNSSGQLYYKTIKALSPGSELFIWYSNDYAAYLKVPPILPSYIKGSSFHCPYCAESFIYTNSLRAHLRFKCKYRHHVVMAQKAAAVASAPLNCLVSNPPKSEPSSRADSPSKASLPQYKTPESPQSSIPESASPCPTPDATTTKRPRDDDEDTPDQPSPKRLACYSPASDVSDRSCSEKLSPSLPTEAVEARSAFQRVDRLKKLSPEPSVPNMAKIPANSMLNPNLHRDTSHMQPMHPYHVLASQRLPMAAMMGSKLGLTPFRDSNKDVEMMKGFDNNNIHKMPYPPPPELNALPQGVPYVYRSPNPMVDRMLNVVPPRAPPVAPSLSLAQNWCAKCNATFRMTSDLVYHMRSHHKREFDPAKKKRDDKLRCEVCGETFRERHHLTRHMTSHA